MIGAGFGRADSSCLAALARRNDKGWVCGQGLKKRIPPVSLRSRVGMTRLGLWAGLEKADSSCLAALARRNDKGWVCGQGLRKRIPPVSLRSRVGMIGLEARLGAVAVPSGAKAPGKRRPYRSAESAAPPKNESFALSQAESAAPPKTESFGQPHPGSSSAMSKAGSSPRLRPGSE